MAQKELQAERLRALIKALRDKGGSVKKLVKASGVHEGNIYLMRKGLQGITAEMAQRLAPHLGVSPSYLLGFDDDPATPSKASTYGWVLRWWEKLAPEVRDRVVAYGNALSDEHRLRTAGKPRPTKKPRTARTAGSK